MWLNVERHISRCQMKTGLIEDNCLLSDTVWVSRILTYSFNWRYIAIVTGNERTTDDDITIIWGNWYFLLLTCEFESEPAVCLTRFFGRCCMYRVKSGPWPTHDRGLCIPNYVKSTFSIDRVSIGKHHLFFLYYSIYIHLNHKLVSIQNKPFHIGVCQQKMSLDGGVVEPILIWIRYHMCQKAKSLEKYKGK